MYSNYNNLKIIILYNVTTVNKSKYLNIIKNDEICITK